MPYYVILLLYKCKRCIQFYICFSNRTRMSIPFSCIVFCLCISTAFGAEERALVSQVGTESPSTIVPFDEEAAAQALCRLSAQCRRDTVQTDPHSKDRTKRAAEYAQGLLRCGFCADFLVVVKDDITRSCGTCEKTIHSIAEPICILRSQFWPPKDVALFLQIAGENIFQKYFSGHPGVKVEDAARVALGGHANFCTKSSLQTMGSSLVALERIRRILFDPKELYVAYKITNKHMWDAVLATGMSPAQLLSHMMTNKYSLADTVKFCAIEGRNTGRKRRLGSEEIFDIIAAKSARTSGPADLPAA